MREVIGRVSKELGISRDEAELLVASLLDKPRFSIYMNDTIDARTRQAVEQKLALLKQDMPIEYVTKRAYFREYELRIEPGVFIPRLETEYFIDLIIKHSKNPLCTILDVGTGSGAIAIALAHAFPCARIVATDISEPALRCARANLRTYGLERRVVLVHSDMLRALSGQFDMIVSNPPYIPHARLPLLPRSVRDYEPLVALDGGEHGVQFITQLITHGKKLLTGNGSMAIEIDEEQVDIVRDFLTTTVSMPFSFYKDLCNRFRYVFIGNRNV